MTERDSSTKAYIYIFLWNLIIITGTSYVVFGLGQSGWWFLLAVCLLATFGDDDDDKEESNGLGWVKTSKKEKDK